MTPEAGAALVSAIRAGRANGVLPPIVAVDADGLIRAERHLSGRADADLVAELLARPDFSGLLELLATLANGCTELRSTFPGVLAEGVLQPLNGALFGPLTGSAFLACLGGADSASRYNPRAEGVRFLAFLRTFLERLPADADRLWFDAQFPVTGLTAHDGETHNGRQRVLRVDFSDGRSVAYKPRPADVDRLFLARQSSVFALLNELPPASGSILLPLMEQLPGDGTYSWQEWIEPPAQWGVLRQRAGNSLSGARLDDAGVFWHRAGSLTAACFGFGITDLAEGNLAVGVRPGQPQPLMYPIDLELALVEVRRLPETGLVGGPDTPHHHVGLESEPRFCALDGPTLCLVEVGTDAAGRATALATRPRSAPWARQETRTVVADREGQLGYGAYPTRFLRGMFDAWTLLVGNVPKLQAVLEQPATTRVLLRSTSGYTEPLDDFLLTGAAPPDDFIPAEREQFLRYDVPYFYRSLRGGPLKHWDPATGASVETGHEVPPPLDWAGGLTLSRLGVALRDAVTPIAEQPIQLIDEHAHLVVRDPEHGAVGFDWPEANRRFIYQWHGQKLKLRLSALDELAAIRERLLKVDAVDASWRGPWADGAFQDEAIAERLAKLTTVASTWLRQVIEQHGWPGPLLVGEDAADAACRLVQHLDDQADFQRSCLELLTAAVDVPRSQVAYLTDTLRLAEDRPQVYGTKFRTVDGRLVPCALEDPGTVDERRSAVGLEPLAAYAARLQQRFPHATTTTEMAEDA
ncbi:DUF4135 domain-containing protein [Kribbella sp. CA-293567]|uniref:DUF4135 domain-containing protein n=1 Tax=Kribbella sp. CA-293567 TaxID=3002436 RepID=UPI0022DD9995|nr:DUF4135 domain-containing protein [Kribbella sp. CA-293567]WBQ08038.1 DUF4135 domain-containing protein [Kribbella sp. CA-293567]